MSEFERSNVVAFIGKSGYAGKSGGEGDRAWYRNSIGVYQGKDKETDKAIYFNVGYFLRGDELKYANAIDSKAKYKVEGALAVDRYKDKDGQPAVALSVNFAKITILEEVSETVSDSVINGVDLSAYSNAPFDDGDEPF